MSEILHWVDEVLKGTAANVFLETVATFLAILLAWFFPRLGDARFRSWELRFKSFAANRRRAMWIVFLIPIVFRVAEIPLYPPPQPTIHDEFSYLLIADTVAHGRLANPTHPMWRHFETIHVIFEPAYASKYPIGQGVMLGVPLIFGLPAYWGVWISNGLMSAAALWMLRAWLSPSWAFFAVAVVFLRVTTLSTWVHSYWGGAVSAIGGALALGAFARLVKKPIRKNALILGAGIAILANTRPYEGAVVAAVLGVSLLLWLVRAKDVSRDVKVRQVIAPLCAIGVFTLAFIALHNYQVTGNPLQLPYQRNQVLYGTPQSFYWQRPIPAPVFHHLELQRNYLWQLSMYQHGQNLDEFLNATWLKFREFWLFFFGPIWTVPLLVLPWLIRSRDLRIPLLAIVLVFIAVGVYPFFFPHYLGPIAGALLLILVMGLRRLREFGQFGITLSRYVVLVALASVLWQIGVDVARYDPNRQWRMPRTQVLEALDKIGGSHVIFVRYNFDHDFHKEIVYNAADIDASPIVWARDMGPISNQELLNFYKGRKFWMFEPDFHPPRLVPYEQAMPIMPLLR